MNRRRALLIVFAVVLAGAAFLFDPRNLFDDEEPAAAFIPETAPVTVETLTVETELEGTLVFAGRTDVYVRHDRPTSTVITELVDEGTVVVAGDLLWRSGNEPTIALTGDLPAHRTVAEDAVGLDVLQLEESLVALGYDPGGTVTVDETFTANTAAMVERWQEAIGAEVTGEVAFGSVVFLPGPVRVAETGIDVGDDAPDGTLAFAVHEEERQVVFTLPASDRDELAAGDVVRVTLPDRTQVDAEVASLVDEPSGGRTVTATVLEPVDVDATEAPVTVSWQETVAVDVSTVPATALIRTEDGNYHVQRTTGAGETELVAVTVGDAADGRVEIDGDLAVGDLVIAP